MKIACLLAAVVAALFCTKARADDRCSDILANGVWQYDISQTDIQNVSSFLNWYKSANSGSTTTSKKQSLNSSVVYDGAPISLGLSNDQQQNSQFLNQLDTLNSGYQQYNSSVIKFVQTASPVITKAWSDCMSQRKGGILASIEFTGDPHDLLLNLSFQPIDQTPKASVTLNLAGGLQCGNNTVAVPSTVTTVVRCKRTNGNAGTIVINSKTVVSPANSLAYNSILFPLSGAYGTCAVTEEIENNNSTYGPPEPIQAGGVDISGGGPKSTNLLLDAGAGYKLTNPVKHCSRNAGDNPCAFLIPTAESPITWSIPDRAVYWNPTNNSDSVTVWITGNKSKVIPGFTRQPNGTISLSYGKAFSVEFPNTALDVILTCQAGGNNRIYSLNDIAAKGEQVYLKDIRQGAAEKIYDLAVAPYDVSP